LPADVEASPYGPRLSALLGSAFPLSFSKTRALSGDSENWSGALHH
jgi:hypothetical protein